MEEHYLESAEFYNRRYSSFSVRVILPTFFLLIFVVLFSLFAKKEITITSGASIEPSSKIRPLLLKIQQLVIHRQSWGI